MIKRAIQALSFAGLIASGAWLWIEPGPEPLVALITSIGAFLGTLASGGASGWSKGVRLWFGRVRDRSLQLLLGKRHRPLERIAYIEFSWPPSGKLVRHEVIARRLHNVELSNEVVVLTHFGTYIGGYDFCILQGHTIDFTLADFDADGTPELAVTFHCGAHTKGFLLFRLNEERTLAPVPGSSIGSDWPEIAWRDDDDDGKLEIYAKSRNWSGAPTEEWIEERYVLKGERYEEDLEYQHVVSAGEGEERRTTQALKRTPAGAA